MNHTIRKMTENDRDTVLDMMRVFYASPAVFTNGSEEIFQKFGLKICISSQSTGDWDLDKPFSDL